MSSGTLQTLSAVCQGRGLLQYPLTLHIIGGDDEACQRTSGTSSSEADAQLVCNVHFIIQSQMLWAGLCCLLGDSLDLCLTACIWNSMGAPPSPLRACDRYGLAPTSAALRLKVST